MAYDRETARQAIAAMFDNLPREAMARGACASYGKPCHCGGQCPSWKAFSEEIDAAISAARAEEMRG